MVSSARDAPPTKNRAWTAGETKKPGAGPGFGSRPPRLRRLLQPLLLTRGAGVAEADHLAVLVDRGHADAAHVDQLVDVRERSVGFAVLDDRLGLGLADAVQGFGQLLGRGGVDIDRLGGKRRVA